MFYYPIYAHLFLFFVNLLVHNMLGEDFQGGGGGDLLLHRYLRTCLISKVLYLHTRLILKGLTLDTHVISGGLAFTCTYQSYLSRPGFTHSSDLRRLVFDYTYLSDLWRPDFTYLSDLRILTLQTCLVCGGLAFHLICLCYLKRPCF